ncbi:flagellar hook-basal body protein [Bacillus horti]|uniref:Flagellar basal-body rod protein FlgG n=1 Tax=Caldalkalibacillus horti TaxID=77523 RepID=A0ABT9VZL7_9BACI|nr:flagellar hook-basal body protein [Bacillus horti]MDQ0166426.1 flagellar basal-body rod protein FlgG [Bacillus horti]
MNFSMVTAANSLNQVQKKIDTISHNIANVGTAGYKRRNATFQELLVQEVTNQPHPQKEMGRITPDGIRLGSGVGIGQTTVFLGQGAIQETGRHFDFLIQGERGWFPIQRTTTDENGDAVTETLYTRSGSFQVVRNPGFDPETDTDDVMLVTSQGDVVLGSDGPITFSSEYKSFNVSPAGEIHIELADGTTVPATSNLQIMEIARPDLLVGVGESLFRLENTQGLNADVISPIDLTAREGYAIQQGALEMSNVDLTQELTELLAAQRLLQFQTRAISLADDMMGLANTIRS